MSDDIVERLKAKDAEWQSQCDKWLATAADMGVLDQWLQSEPLIRPTIEAEAAAEITRLRQELAEARERHESLKSLTIKCSERMDKDGSKALHAEADAFDLRSALEPFASWAANNVELVTGSVDGAGNVTPGYWQWKDAPMRDRIVDWFGPSDFGAAIRSLAEKETKG